MYLSKCDKHLRRFLFVPILTTFYFVLLAPSSEASSHLQLDEAIPIKLPKNERDKEMTKLETFFKQDGIRFDFSPEITDQEIYLLHKAVQHYKKAKSIFEGLATHGPAIAEKQQKKAINELRKLISQFPTTNLLKYVFYLLGKCSKEMGKFEEAMETFSIVIDRYPRSSDVSSRAYKEMHEMVYSHYWRGAGGRHPPPDDLIRMLETYQDKIQKPEKYPFLLWSSQVDESIHSLTLTDLDRDGYADIVAVGENNIYGLSGLTGAKLWSSPFSSELHHNLPPVIVNLSESLNKLIVVSTNNGLLYAIDGCDGEYIWNYNTNWKNIRSIAISDFSKDNVEDVVVINKNAIFIVDGKTGQLLQKYAFNKMENFTKIAITDLNNDNITDIIIAAETGHWKIAVHAINGKTGKMLWTFADDGDCISAKPAIGDLNSDDIMDIVIGSEVCQASLGTGRSKIYAINGNNGKILWRYPAPKGFSIPFIGLANLHADGRLDVVAEVDRGLWAYNGKSGKRIWSIKKPDITKPELGDLDQDNLIDHIVAISGRQVLAIKAQTGEILWRLNWGISISTSPRIADLNGDTLPELAFASKNAVFVISIPLGMITDCRKRLIDNANIYLIIGGVAICFILVISIIIYVKMPPKYYPAKNGYEKKKRTK